ncbi:MAG: undecaprenyldiphospho-muramoylpentapeptide beta-N-acetylglucosaminyltransferase [Pseudomonadota bacterium]
MTIMIAAGGTGGHIFPGIAVAMALKRALPGTAVEFIGSHRGLEEKIVPKYELKLNLIKAASWKDKGKIGKVLVLLTLPFLVVKTLLLLRKRGTKLIISLGGYASVPVLLAGWLLKIPMTLVEPNAIPGVTTRALSRFAKKIFVAYPKAARYFVSSKAVMSGVPLRVEIEAAAKHDVKKAPRGRMTLLCFGGSQGSRALNRALLNSLPYLKDLGDKLAFIHVVGKWDDPEAIGSEYKKAGFKADVLSFCDDIWKLYERADLLLSRAGALTLAEAAAFGIPMILVPFPAAADDHQRANASYFVSAGTSISIEESQLTAEKLASEIKGFFDSPERREAMSSAMKNMARFDATEIVTQMSLRLINDVQNV